MKLLLSLLGWLQGTIAQKHSHPGGTPITISIFTESVSLPNFRFDLRKPNMGLRIGTEFHYNSNKCHQLFQTVSIGFFDNHGLKKGMFVNTEPGYQKLIGQFFADVRIGGGYMLQRWALPLYKPAGNGTYLNASPFRHLLMPIAGIGAGHRSCNGVDLFGRYEVFGETPFGINGIPILPHKALHFRTRLHSK